MRRVLLVFVTAFALSSCAAAAYAPTLGSEAVTPDEYNQLANGMTLEQVSEVIGSDGTQVASSSLGGDQMEMYRWKGTIPGSNVVCSFTNDQLDVKAQDGL